MSLISELSSFLAAKEKLVWQPLLSFHNENFLEMILGRFAPNLRIRNCEKISIQHERDELREQDNVWCIVFLDSDYDCEMDREYEIELCHLVVTEELLFDFIKSSIETLKCST